MRQRDRMVGGTHDAEWLIRQHERRSGGSSSTLSSAWRQSVALIDRIDNGDVPSPSRAVSRRTARCGGYRRPDQLVQYAFVIEHTLDHEKIGLALRGDPARHRIVLGDASDSPTSLGTAGSGYAMTKRAIR